MKSELAFISDFNTPYINSGSLMATHYVRYYNPMSGNTDSMAQVSKLNEPEGTWEPGLTQHPHCKIWLICAERISLTQHRHIAKMYPLSVPLRQPHFWGNEPSRLEVKRDHAPHKQERLHSKPRERFCLETWVKVALAFGSINSGSQQNKLNKELVVSESAVQCFLYFKNCP